MKPIIRCITLFACLLALCFSVSAADARTIVGYADGQCVGGGGQRDYPLSAQLSVCKGS